MLEIFSHVPYFLKNPEKKRGFETMLYSIAIALEQRSIELAIHPQVRSLEFQERRCLRSRASADSLREINNGQKWHARGSDYRYGTWSGANYPDD